MKFEIIYTDTTVKYIEAESLLDVFKQVGNVKPIQLVKGLVVTKNREASWCVCYNRKYKEVLAYVNAYVDNLPIASVPLLIQVESYQSIKQVKDIILESERILAIWPNAKIKIQRNFVK
jgi:hypothetical protein